MPPRSKTKGQQELSEWSRCELCGSQLGCQRDLDVHRSNQCSWYKSDPSGRLGLADIKCACITVRGTLLATLAVHQQALVEKSTSPIKESVVISKQRSRNLLCMNPSTMAACNLVLLSPVVVNHCHIFQVWPDPSLQTTTVAVRKNELKETLCSKVNDWAVVYSLSPEKIIDAKEIHIQTISCVKSCIHDPQVIQHLTCNREYVPIGTDFTFVYLATAFVLRIVKLLLPDNAEMICDQTASDVTFATSIHEDRNLDVSNIDEIDQSFSELELSDKRAGRWTGVTGAFVEVYGNDDERALRFVRLNSATKYVMSLTPAVNTSHIVPPLTFDMVGGHKQVKTVLLKLVDIMLNASKNIRRFVRTAVILFGPPGTGKTMVATALAANTGFPLLNFTDVLNDTRKDYKEEVQKFFSDACLKSPCILLIDRLETICPQTGSAVRTGASHHSIYKAHILQQELSNMIAGDCKVLVIGTTSRLNEVDISFRQPSLFGIELELNIPSSKERADILINHLYKYTDLHHNLSQGEIRSVAERAHGYVGADLASVCQEARTLVKTQPSFSSFPYFQSQLTKDHLDAALGRVLPSTMPEIAIEQLSKDHLDAALGRVLPSAMREIAIERPKVSWSDIAVPASLRLQLEQCVDWPRRHAAVFKRFKISPPKGVLMYGPPGCSKTMIAKAIARESGLNFISIKAGELLGKWVGDSERAVHEVFRKARAAQPVVIFFDELDALASHRGKSGVESGGVSDRVVAQLLTEMAGIEPLTDITIIAATNRPDNIDPALKRPGRFDRLVYVPLPDTETRRQIFNIHFSKMPPLADDVDLDLLIQRTDRFSGSEVVTLIKEAFSYAISQNSEFKALCSEDFTAAFDIVKPETTIEDILFYDDYAKQT